jgi:hypothetical protein
MSQLEHYLVIKDGKRAPANHPAMHEPPYAKVELFWPLDLCRDGVHIIDTPGVSDDPEREKITTNYITLADMVLYVLACDDQSSMSARQVIETIREASHEHIFFICNRINVIDAGEQDMVKGRCISLLAPFTKQGARHVFFLNARSALNGRLSGNSELLEQSGLSMVEQELQTFLTTERGRIKFIPPATELRASIRAARSILAEKAALPRADLQMPQVLHLKPQRALDRLELERQQLVTWLATFRDETRKRVNEEASDFYGTVAYKLESWVQTYEIKHPVGLLGVFSKEAQEKVVEEVTKFLTERVAHESQVWQASTLHPLLIRIVENMEQELNERIKRLAQNLEQADLKAVLGVPPTISSEAFSDFSVADTTMAALAGWKPQIFIPDLLLGGSGGAALNINAINRKIKEAVGKEYAQKLQTSRSALAIAITKGVDKTTYKELGKVQGEVNHWLELKARNIQDQGTPIIEEKQQQQSKVDEVTPGLAAISDELDTIESEVDNLIKQVALAKSRV